MKHLLRFVAFGALSSASLFSQDFWFTAQATGSLAAAGTTATLQQVAGGNKNIYLDTITVECPAACTITQAQNGTAATATAGTARGLNPTSYAQAQATFWTDSNVGSGVAAGGRVTCSAACMVVLDVSKIVLPTGSSGLNYSTTISAVTGTYSITYQWRER